jgi:outer membrane biosynthesis protein TonB
VARARNLIAQAALPVALLVAGILVAVLAGDSTAGVAAAMALIGSAAVVAVALAFLAVGRAEDRDRAQEPAASAAPPEPKRPPAPERPPVPPEAEHPRTLGLGPERRYKRPPRRPQ